MKNFLLRCLVRCVRPFLDKHPRKGRILIVSTTALGDTLWATAAIENIRISFPDSYIGVLTSPIGMEVLQGNPHINALFLLKRPWQLWKTLYREQFDTVLLFHASQRFVLPLCSLLGSSRIIGTARINKGLDDLFTLGLPNLRQHEIVRRLEIAKAIGAHIHVETLSMFVQMGKKTLSGGPWIVLHPGSKDPFKRWPKEQFCQLGRALKSRLNCEILITGTAGEEALMEEVGRGIPGAKIDQPNRPLREFAALLQEADLLICNDTGPLHLACALNRPAIGIYAATDPILCGPHKASQALTCAKPPTCTPCLKRKCRQPFCLLQIGVDEVLEKVIRILGHPLFR
jgi:ADP-heptose:LPS heptosyltransferase